MSLPLEWLDRLAPELAEQPDQAALLHQIEAVLESLALGLSEIQGVNAVEPAVFFVPPEGVQP